MVRKDQIETLVNDYTEHLLLNPNLCGEIMYRDQFRYILEDVLELVDKETVLSVIPYFHNRR